LGEAGGSNGGCFAAATDDSTANKSVSLRISQSRHVFLFSSSLKPIPTSKLLCRKSTQQAPSSSASSSLSTPHKSHKPSLLSSLALALSRSLSLFSLTNLQAPPVYQTPCLLFLSLLCSPVYPNSLLFVFLFLFLLPSLPPTPSLTFFCTPSCAPQFIQALSLSLSLSYYCFSLAFSSLSL
jgi:hypothetical protein